ncbi:hypothetical protein [uncultured Fibrobacter sp.]|jgi:hypothetical protein|uniref:hypothetical protein n=1 Tax=uncultured Fibrobacter sp. TaxID=261512 RepID=UPI00260B8858|nr:hypothetical protein [uncultured Fibrobacter sp.]
MMNCFDETRNAFRPGKPWRAKTGILLALVLGVLFGACSDSEKVSGTSEEAEGIVAITNKQIAGVAQKGPFVKGSNIVLAETSADGSLKPTGKEFFATTRTDKGDFQIDGINLESQFVRLKATGYYKRETTGENTVCQISLRALSDIRDRDQININILTHLEYDRALYLVKNGKSFAEAKKQAREEWMQEFGYENLADDFENLDIANDGKTDKALEQISAHFDECMFGEYCGSICAYETNNDCSGVQAGIDDLARVFSTSGELPGLRGSVELHGDDDFFKCIYEWMGK